ncbi:lysM domain receptor-like kinase 3 [Rhodamnia argentea]|uniref:LysM domain receptor-like kinase 3 n=1 Tax=Rhodamnia argentea TaxID=178133 RepID=A0A8B8QKJ0_9MYRT|nr:lysM domain receptor-like kinase 3 [Rhodamnia argentea]XP_048134909.1 lysM domain receptor-like kinase 3 [Rhodamnia argentea]XP_048134910.1 lysM domain receptor-like kinase 3 [Rhodamnia argentea]
MCRSRKATDSIQPNLKCPRRAPSSSSKASSIDPSSSSNFFTVTSTATASSSFNNRHHRSSPSDSSSLPTTPSYSLPAHLKHHLHDTPKIYPLSDLSSATGNFLLRRLSPSSSAWRCSLRGRDVAVFRRGLRRPVGLPRLRELLASICRSHHSSVAKLLGASLSESDVYLVYEYVKGASLCDCLRNRVNPDYSALASWASRMRVATDVAHGLEYIHHCTGMNGSGFVHNRIKSSSIVVTEDSLSAKICHFGMAELCGEVAEEDEPLSSPDTAKPKRTNSSAMKFEGTRGYMSPEFRSTGTPTRKSDVYAFGVVVLELLSGEEPLKYSFDGESDELRRTSVIEGAREAAAGASLRRWVDKRLKDSYPVEVAEKMVELGLECVDDDPEKRPDMGRVAGRVSKLYLESKKWGERFALPQDFSASMAPR